MKTTIFALLALLSFSNIAKDMTDVMASIHGTCTHQTCPPGSAVMIDATEGDSGIAITPEGEQYDLLQLKKIPLNVVRDADNNRPEYQATVSTEKGDRYYIEWLFLKKK